MATCLITVGGTYGEVLFNYIDAGSVARSIVSGTGEFYLDDDGSDYTYSVLYGDVTASSLCITLTEIEFKCYLIYWNMAGTCNLGNQYTLQSVIAGDIEYSLYEKMGTKSFTGHSIGPIINDLGYPIITAPSCQGNSIVIRTLNGQVPYLKFSDKLSTYNIYLKGVEITDCVPAGYSELDVWPVIPVTTTSTTTTTTVFAP